MAVQSSLDPDALPQIIGDFRPVDEWQIHINDLFYGLRGTRLREFYQTFASADYRLAYALAEDYYRRLCQRDQKRVSAAGQAQEHAQSPLIVMEWGCGNGNLAACFLDRFKALDTSNRYYPILEYQLIDKNAAVLNEAQNNAALTRHQANVTFINRCIEDLQDIHDGTVDRIICNELWSELPTKLILRKASELSEEHIRPNVSEAKLAEIQDWSGFVQAFDEKDVPGLQNHPSFFEDLVWEREYHEVEAKSLSFRRTINDYMKQIDEEVLVPVNTGASASIKEAMRLLAPDAIGLSAFDAGTADSQVLNDPDKPCYSVHGGQFSFMVNFAMLEDIGKHLQAKRIVIEPQREYVGNSLGETVMTLMDLLAAHPRLPESDSWKFDALIIRTLEVLNKGYASPYQQRIDFPIRESTPSDERTTLTAILEKLNPNGLPDTIAYITETEIRKVQSSLEELGYDEEGIRMMLQMPAQLVDYTHFYLSPS